MKATIFRLFFLVGMLALGGTATAVAQDTNNGGYAVVTNAGFTGRWVEGTDGSHRFQGENDVVSDDDEIINLGGGLCGVRVQGRGELSNEHRVRAFNCPTDTVEVFLGGESIPVAPNSCVDTQGRERLARPCRGS